MSFYSVRQQTKLQVILQVTSNKEIIKTNCIASSLAVFSDHYFEFITGKRITI